MPEISADGRTWTIRIQPGILFADAPAFKGRPRELVAQDYVYSITRRLDPTMKRGGDPALANLIEGARAVVDAAAKAASSTTTRRSRGCRRSTATRCDSSSPPSITRFSSGSPISAPSPSRAKRSRRRATTSDQARRHGTVPPARVGPRIARRARRQSRVPAACFPDDRRPALQPLVQSMKGRKLPALSRIEISIIEEQVPELLAFDQGSLDYVR
jgi:hypothetical protein